jgi:hypothetical protein
LGMQRMQLDFALRGSLGDALAHHDTIVDWLERFATLLLGNGVPVEVRTSSGTSGQFSGEGLRRATRRLAEGKLTSVCVQTDTERQRGDFVYSCYHMYPERLVSDIWFSAAFDENRPLTDKEFVRLSREIALGAGLANGILLRYEPPVRSAGSNEFESRGTQYGPKALGRFARHAGWGMWLTAGHLAGLGGKERMLREAPVARIEDHVNGLWMELTSSPWDVPDDALRRLEEFLDPILAKSREEVRAADPELIKPERRMPEYGLPTPQDKYSRYKGPPVEWRWLPETGEDELVLNLHLREAPSKQGASALARAVLAWYNAGSDEAFEGGGFHDIGGPNWDGPVVRWNVDLGFADAESAVTDLARRLGGWAAKWQGSVESLRLGIEEP